MNSAQSFRFRLGITASVLWTAMLLVTGADRPYTAPKLVLVLSVDQLRSDYLTRFSDLFEPAIRHRESKQVYGGFRLLQERGACYVDARHDHFPLFTGPGHAVQLTGAHPYKSGIVGNYWYDRVEKQGRRYCVEDLTPKGQVIGTRPGTKKESGISPAPLLVSTVGDELRMATGGRAKVWGLALKDRAAVLMAGHLSNGALWFNEDTGDWVSSRYYCTNGSLPAWVTDLNTGANRAGTRLVDTFTNRVWRFGFPAAAPRIWTGARDFCHSQTSTNYRRQ